MSRRILLVCTGWLSACGALSGGEGLAGDWTCRGDSVEGDEGSTWDPSEDGIGVRDDGGAWVLTGWSECQPEVDLPATGNAERVTVGDVDCDTRLGWVHVEELRLEAVGAGAARWSGSIVSVVTDPVDLEEGFEWSGVECERG
jgi:hypothetical protein